MDDRDLKLECVKLAIQLVSPTVSERVDAVVETATALYNHVNSQEVVEVGGSRPIPDEADKPRRGRPPKPRAE